MLGRVTVESDLHMNASGETGVVGRLCEYRQAIHDIGEGWMVTVAFR